MRVLVAALLAAAIAAPASARMHAPYRGHRIQPSAAPLDLFVQPAAAYSFRKLRTAYTGPAIRLRRASDNAELDIGFLSFTGFTGAPIDTAAANAHCASTTCFITTRYDQSGNARHLPQATQANQPALIFGCALNGLPCARMTSAAQGMGLAGITPAGTITMNAVSRPTVRGSAGCVYLAVGNNLLTQHNSTDNTVLDNFAVTISAAASAAAWHSNIGVLSGTAVLRVDDGVETAPGGMFANTAGGAIYMVGAAGATCDTIEQVYWDNYGLTAAERAALVANQRAFGLIP